MSSSLRDGFSPHQAWRPLSSRSVSSSPTSAWVNRGLWSPGYIPRRQGSVSSGSSRSSRSSTSTISTLRSHRSHNSSTHRNIIRDRNRCPCELCRDARHSSSPLVPIRTSSHTSHSSAFGNDTLVHGVRAIDIVHDHERCPCDPCKRVRDRLQAMARTASQISSPLPARPAPSEWPPFLSPTCPVSPSALVPMPASPSWCCSTSACGAHQCQSMSMSFPAIVTVQVHTHAPTPTPAYGSFGV